MRAFICPKAQPPPPTPSSRAPCHSVVVSRRAKALSLHSAHSSPHNTLKEKLHDKRKFLTHVENVQYLSTTSRNAHITDTASGCWTTFIFQFNIADILCTSCHKLLSVECTCMTAKAKQRIWLRFALNKADTDDLEIQPPIFDTGTVHLYIQYIHPPYINLLIHTYAWYIEKD